MNKTRLLFAFGILGLLTAGCSNNTETPTGHQHNWGAPTYTWSDNYSSCTAERSCQDDHKHKETETVDTTYSLLIKPTCDSDGLGEYTAVFKNSAFKTQLHSVTFDATGHDWGETVYTWSADNSTCTAQRVCKTNSSHKETETVKTSLSVLIPATCEEDGSGRYIASFTNRAFVIQKKVVAIDATGHVWEQPTYVWSQDNLSCTAERVCANDNEHKQTETASTTYSVVNEATCEKDGLGRYTATFTNNVFTQQTKDIIIDSIGHEWGLPSYSWDISGLIGVCKAERVCLRDENHRQAETRMASSTLIKDATYDEAGLRRFTATFTNTAFETQTTDVVIPIKDKLLFINHGTYCAVRAASTNIYGAIDIPEYHDGLPVAEIDDFSSCSRITSVSIPSTVETISSRAFEYCNKLESVTFSEGLKTIADSAFNGCVSITNIELPESVETVGPYAFTNCTNLLTFKCGDNIEQLDQEIFFGCSSLETLTVPFIGKTASTEQYLGYWFGFGQGYVYDNLNVPSSLKELIISDACSSLGNHALDRCNSIEHLRIPFIGGSKTENQFFAYIFGGSTVDDEVVKVPPSLKKVVVGDTCTEIADKAFCNCASLEEIELSSGILSIGWRAFYGCSSIESLIIPESVTSIGDSAFGYMTSLVSLNILGLDTRVGSSVFAGCTSLISINLPSENIYYSSSNGAIFNKDGTRLICCPGGLEGTFTVPSTVTEIEEYAFYSCDKLTNIVIPDSVTTIEKAAFAHCSSLETIDLPDNLNVLAPQLFYGCSSLESVSLPNGLTSIGSSVFYGCSSLASLDIPSTVASIGDRAFVECSSLEELILPLSLQSIGEYCFAKCSSLESIDIPAGVLSLEQGLFLRCGSLETVVLHPGLKTIGQGAFLNCSSLTSIDVPDSVTIIEAAAFGECTSLTSFEMPHYVTDIEQELFKGCTSLEAIELPYITAIADNAFYGCSSLREISFGESLSSIGNNSFYNCNHLTEISYAGTIAQWASVTKGSGWEYSFPAIYISCSDGDTYVFEFDF